MEPPGNLDRAAGDKNKTLTFAYPVSTICQKFSMLIWVLPYSTGINPYQECISAALGSLFEQPLVENSVLNVYRDHFSPTVSIVPSSTQIQFDISSSENFT